MTVVTSPPEPRRQIITGDALTELRQLPPDSIDMVLTSPPYFRLRDYQADGQIGLEPVVTDWVTEIGQVADELARVLTPTGSLWLNLGDTYATQVSQGAQPKSLLLAPERAAITLVERGWTLRNKIVWAKSNPMPTSVRDRLACTYELIYVFTRSRRAYFDLDAIRLPHRSQPGRTLQPRERPARERWRGPNSDGIAGLDILKASSRVGHPLGKNPGDVWTFATSGYRGSHRATFPLPLVARAILAGCPERRCVVCRLPWRRPVIRALGGAAVRGTIGPTCDCDAPSEPGIVLDPFFGVGTTAAAAEHLGRDWLGIELSPAFAAEAEQRIAAARGSPRTAA
jgi:site-specific DNA-methyltransferase (adenine-specific)